MKAKHRILAAGMAAAMTLSLAACGGSASTAEPTASSTVEAAAPEATSEAAGGDVTEVTWWTYFGDKNIGYLQNIIDDFNNSQKQCWIQFCRVQDKRLYWSPLCLDRSKLLANMTPQEMLE